MQCTGCCMTLVWSLWIGYLSPWTISCYPARKGQTGHAACSCCGFCAWPGSWGPSNFDKDLMLSRIFYTPRLENLRMFVCCVTRISVSLCRVGNNWYSSPLGTRPCAVAVPNLGSCHLSILSEGKANDLASLELLCQPLLFFLKSWRFDSSCPWWSLGYPIVVLGPVMAPDSKPSALSLYTLHGHGCRQLCCDPERYVCGHFRWRKTFAQWKLVCNSMMAGIGIWLWS